MGVNGETLDSLIQDLHDFEENIQGLEDPDDISMLVNSAISTCGLPICIKDSLLRTRFMNQAFIDIFGIESGEYEQYRDHEGWIDLITRKYKLNDQMVLELNRGRFFIEETDEESHKKARQVLIYKWPLANRSGVASICILQDLIDSVTLHGIEELMHHKE